MANNFNLIPVRNSEEAREKGRKGGIASGIARRRKSELLKSPMRFMDEHYPGFAVLSYLALVKWNTRAAEKVLKLAGAYPLKYKGLCTMYYKNNEMKKLFSLERSKRSASEARRIL